MQFFKILTKYLCLIALLSSVSSKAETSPKQQITPTELEISIKNINQALVDLNQLQNKALGQDKLALKLQLFQKNQELRQLISQGVNQGGINKDFLIKQVTQQKSFTNQGPTYLGEQSAKISEQLNQAKNENKFSLMNQYEESRKYLDSMYEEATENFLWSKTLGASTDESEQKIKIQVRNRIEQLAANIHYLEQQLAADNTQLQVAPESEKVNIQLRILTVDKRLQIATASLKVMVTLADKLGIPSTEFKRIYFEATGSITEYLINPDVIFSLIKTWSNRLGCGS